MTFKLDISKGLDKVLVFDIETIPCLGWFWRTGKTHINADQILEPNRIICISYMFIGEKKAHCLVWDKKQCDKKMLEDFTKVVEKATTVIGHNSNNFDVKHINGRIAFHGLKPISWGTLEDTYRALKRKITVPSFKLQYLLKYFGIGSKLRTEIGLWLDVWLRKDLKALDRMVKYCINDTEQLEKLIKKIIPYMHPITNHSVRDAEACPTCGSDDVIKYGYRYTRVGKYQRFKCGNCGADHISGTSLIKGVKR